MLVRLLISVLLTGSSAEAFAGVRDDFNCLVARSQTFGDAGMTITPQETLEQGTGQAFNFREATGAFAWATPYQRIDYNVVQHGSTANGVVAVSAVQGPASFSVKTLRIRTWAPVVRDGEQLYPFMLVDEDTVHTGYCRTRVWEVLVRPPR